MWILVLSDSSISIARINPYRDLLLHSHVVENSDMSGKFKSKHYRVSYQ
jgi:hypothetical protein